MGVYTYVHRHAHIEVYMYVHIYIYIYHHDICVHMKFVPWFGICDWPCRLAYTDLHWPPHLWHAVLFYMVFAFVPLCFLPACLYLAVGVEYGFVHFDRSAALGAALSLVCGSSSFAARRLPCRGPPFRCGSAFAGQLVRLTGVLLLFVCGFRFRASVHSVCLSLLSCGG